MRPLALCLALLPALALAKGKVVLDAPKPVAGAIEKAVKAKYSVSKGSLSEAPTAGDVKEACRNAGGASAVIMARPVGGDLFNVMVLNGADGSPVATFKVKAGKKFKALPKPDVKTLLEGLSEAKPPGKEAAKPPPEEKKSEETKPAEEKKPEPVAEKPAEQRPAPSEPPAPAREEVRARAEPAKGSAEQKPMALRLGVGFKAFTRRFGYRDDLFNALPTYSLPLGPAVAVDLDLYPAAFLTSGFAANIGVLGEFDYALAIASKTDDMHKYPTTALNLRGSLTVRIPVSVLTVNPFVGYALQTYTIGPDATTGTKPNIPSVGYGGLRGGLQLKLGIGPIGVYGHVAYTYLLSKGEIATYFPHLSVGGLDAGGAVALALFDRLEFRLSFDYQRYWFSMHPVVGDTNVAGGALDIYLSGRAGIAFML